MKVIERILLNDNYETLWCEWDDSIWGYRTPTGFDIVLEDGTCWREWEGDECEDAPDCKYYIQGDKGTWFNAVEGDWGKYTPIDMEAYYEERYYD